jgi:hypothetical protein
LKPKTIILLTLAIVGVVLLFFSLHSALYVGEPWFNERANEPWHLNNYIVVPGVVAFVCCALLAWFLGGFFFGLTIPAFFVQARRKERFLLLSCVLAVAFSTLGFNTSDFMLGCFYWTDMVEPAPVLVDLVLTSFYVNAWNFYFFCFLVPLYLSGFCLGFAVIAKFFRFKR